MANDKELRKQLLALLDGGQTHTPFEEVVKGFPADQRGTVPEGLPYSAWQLVEHIRIAQDDILQFSTNQDGHYKELNWPKDYWPKDQNPPSPEAWDRSLRQIAADHKRFNALISNAHNDLYEPFPWGDGQNLLREAFLIADHLSYHTGELLVLRRVLDLWPAE
jgi:DinB superfamily